MPRHDGAEILQFIRSTLAIASLPVAIFSSSPADVIKRQLTSAGGFADGQFTKPLAFDEFLGFGRVLREWYECRSKGTGSSHLAVSPMSRIGGGVYGP